MAALILTGCAAQPAVPGETENITPPETELQTEPAEEPVAETKTGLVCDLDNGVSVTLGSVTDDVIEGLGKITEQAEAPSCLHDGTDKLYTIDGAYTVTSTAFSDGQERITQISFLSDAVGLLMPDGGVMIGSSEQAVETAFGTPDEEAFGVLTFNLDGGTATVVLTDGVVTALSLAYAE